MAWQNDSAGQPLNNTVERRQDLSIRVGGLEGASRPFSHPFGKGSIAPQPA